MNRSRDMNTILLILAMILVWGVGHFSCHFHWIPFRRSNGLKVEETNI